MEISEFRKQDDAQQNGDHVNALPPEILANILERLTIADRCRAAQVCTTWRDTSYIPQLWRYLEIRLQLDQPLHPAVLSSLAARGIRQVAVMSRNPVGLVDLVRELPQLRCLSLMYSRNLPDSVLHYTFNQQLDKLTELNLVGCSQLRDHTLAVIGQQLRHLRRLSLSKCPRLTDTGTRALLGADNETNEQCEHLQTLALNESQRFTDETLMAVAQHPKLCHLQLSISNLHTAEGFNRLATLKSMVTLEIEQCHVTDDFAAQLVISHCTLVALELTRCDGLSSISLQHLAKLVHLRVLLMTCCFNVGDKGLAYLTKSNIVCLCLGHNLIVTNAGLCHLAQMTTLRKLYLYDCVLSGELGVALLACIKA